MATLLTVFLNEWGNRGMIRYSIPKKRQDACFKINSSIPKASGIPNNA